MIEFDNVEKSEYVTKFEERESGNVLFRAGDHDESFDVPRGRRPFSERIATYDPVEVIEQEGDTYGTVEVDEE